MPDGRPAANRQTRARGVIFLFGNGLVDVGKEVELQADEDRFFRAFHCLQITTEIG